MNTIVINQLIEILSQTNNINMLELRNQERIESNQKQKNLRDEAFQLVYDYLDAYYFESQEKEQQCRNALIWFSDKHKFDEENLMWAFQKSEKNKYRWIDKDLIKIVIRDFRRNK